MNHIIKGWLLLWRAVFRAALHLFGIFLGFMVALKVARRFVKFPAPSFIGRFLDSDLRRTLQPPALIIDRSGVRKGMQVLEIGCGSGAFTTSVARAVGPSGRLYALDIQPSMLDMLAVKLQREENLDINNIELINHSAYELPFEDASLDLVYMIGVMQEIPDKPRLLREVRRVLKINGFLAVSELLPDPDYPWMSTTARMGLRAGFLVDRMEGNLWNYTVRFRKI